MSAGGIYSDGNGFGRRRAAPFARFWALGVLTSLGLLLAPQNAQATLPFGELTQASGTEGCVSESGSPICTDVRSLTNPRAVAISPDGLHAYAIGNDGTNYSVSAYSRNPNSGALTQLSGTDGCVSEDGTPDGGSPTCGDGRALVFPVSLSISADGANVYVGGNQGIAVFSRNPSTGVLTQPSGPDGCVTEDGSSGAGPNTCTNGNAVANAYTLAIDPSVSGSHLYATSRGDGSDEVAQSGVAILNRNPTTGALTQAASTSACITETGNSASGVGTCTNGADLVTGSVAISPDGGNVYIGSGFVSRITNYDRDPTTGFLTVSPTPCISETGTPPCNDGKSIVSMGFGALTISPDGKNAYVTTTGGGGAVGILSLDATTGGLTQSAGLDGCISENGTPADPGNDDFTPTCTDGKGLAGAIGTVVSPDNKSLYVAANSGNGVAAMERNTTTGALIQLAGTAGCISDAGGADCADGRALVNAQRLATDPLGKHVYVTSFAGHALAVLARQTAPRCSGVTQGVSHDSPTTVTLDCENRGTAPMTIAIEAPPSHGAVGPVNQGSRTVTYTPSPGYSGADSFTFKATNGDVSNTASASLSVSGAPGGGGDTGGAGDAGGGGDTGGGTGGGTAFDVDPPETTVKKTKVTDDDVKLTFTSDEAESTFKCRLDRKPFKPCTSPRKLKNLDDGRHKFFVQATDAAGNSDPSPAKARFEIER